MIYSVIIHFFIIFRIISLISRRANMQVGENGITLRKPTCLTRKAKQNNMYNNYTHNNYHQFCIVSQGRKKNVARQGLEPGNLAYRASTQPLSYRATRSTGYKVSQGQKKNVARSGLEPRVFRLPCVYSTTELPSHTKPVLIFNTLTIFMFLHYHITLGIVK